MAIGTLAAIGLGAAGVGSFLGGKSQSKAAKTAAQTQQNVADQNNALAREIYGQNRGILDPYVQRGNAAGNALNDFLGLGTPSPNIGLPAQQPLTPEYYGPSQAYSATYPATIRNALLDAGPVGYGTPGFGLEGTPTAAQPFAAPSLNAGDPFRQYIANSDYAFQFGEGVNRVNSGFAGAGTLQSGAAAKALERFRQDLQSGYRGEYLNLLGNQQGVGLGAGSALAGVGQNYVNTISANNQNAGDAAANAALLRGANNPFANTLSLLGGGLFGMAR